MAQPRRSGEAAKISLVTRVRGLAGRSVRAAGIAAETYTRAACSQRAAAISYHVLFSLVPFVALLVSVLELVLPETTQGRAVAWLLGAVPFPDDVGESVENAVERAGPPATAAGAVALAGLLWTASGMMASIRSAFRAVWASDATRPYLRGKLVDLTLVLGAGVLVVSAFGLTVVVQLVTETSTEIAERLGRDGAATSNLGSLGQLAGSLALAFAAFLLLYRVVPTVAPRLQDVLPGAIVAAVGFHLASAGFSIYVTRFADFDEIYGPMGAVLAFLVLVYVAAMVLLFGACVAAAWPGSAFAAPSSSPAEPLRRKVVRALRGLVVRNP
jgi:membrane protein